jgi:predicted enzyme related to lactoylglutathione lyase/uncharacterized protein YndB with AHSA1/START domain
MIAATEQTTKLRVTRLIKAPRERVFAAWTTPADILKWFGPETCQVVSAKINLRPGGDYHYRVKSEKMGEVKLDGVFREVKQPSKLIYTWSFSGNPQVEFGESQVTVEFLDRKGATEVRITHEQLPNDEVKEDHNKGWNGCLDKLEKHLGVASEAQQEHKPMPVGEFCWNELLTSDEAGATKFYSAVFGWQTANFPGAKDMKYTIWKQQGKGLGGLMKRPKEEIPPHWLGYVTVADVDATVKKVGQTGGKVMMPPLDIPDVGKIAVFLDPQGAALGIIQPIDKPSTCSGNQIVWCDIPVKDLDRAIRFYSAVLGAPVKKEQCEGMTFAVLPHADEHGVSGCLTTGCEGSKSEPSQNGPLLYFNCQGRLDQAVAAAEPNGGKVLQPKHPIGPYGFRAVVRDSEGNRIALHSM